MVFEIGFFFQIVISGVDVLHLLNNQNHKLL